MEAVSREEELWEALLEEAGEELIEAAAAVSVEQAEKELAEAGFDVAAERAKAEAFLRSLEDGTFGTSDAANAAKPAKPAAVAVDAGEAVAAVPAVASVALIDALGSRPPPARDTTPRRGRPVAVWVGVALAAAAAVVAYVERQPSEPLVAGPDTHPSSTSSSPSASPEAPSPQLVAMAADLRRRAATACDAGRPDVCIALLDEAAKKDPAGDGKADVEALRREALEKMQAKPK
ncbi:MAG TPA: hypothetical protein VIY73_10780 [Polyangiaceae bacterium]